MAQRPVSRVQVVVAGAGPVGAVAAYRLAQRGIDVLLLESRSELAEDMRASTFHPPTLEMMAELGLLDALEAKGLRAPIYQYRNRATGEVTLHAGQTGPQDDDVLDDLAEIVLARGGEVLVLEPGKMPQEAAAAATFRW